MVNILLLKYKAKSQVKTVFGHTFLQRRLYLARCGREQHIRTGKASKGSFTNFEIVSRELIQMVSRKAQTAIIPLCVVGNDKNKPHIQYVQVTFRQASLFVG